MGTFLTEKADNRISRVKSRAFLLNIAMSK